MFLNMSTVYVNFMLFIAVFKHKDVLKNILSILCSLFQLFHVPLYLYDFQIQFQTAPKHETLKTGRWKERGTILGLACMLNHSEISIVFSKLAKIRSRIP